MLNSGPNLLCRFPLLSQGEDAFLGGELSILLGCRGVNRACPFFWLVEQGFWVRERLILVQLFALQCGLVLGGKALVSTVPLVSFI